MPELPEVQTTVDGIRPYLQGRKIVEMVVRERRLRWPVSEDLPGRVRGARVGDIRRRGKYILMDVGSGGLLVHLGMSGSMRVLPGDAPPGKHDHFDLRTDRGQVVRYRDPRRFGCLLHTEGAPDHHPRLERLGVEPLEAGFTADYLYHHARRRRVAVKSLLMDGHVVVGVGNIYASEALHLAGIHPLRSCARISLARYGTLVDTVRDVLGNAIRTGGTTLQDFYGADGEPGYFTMALRVYDRAGEPCKGCGTAVRSVVIAQRSTYYCPRCQT